MKCDLKKKLLLFSFMLYLILNVKSTHEVNGTSEKNITVKFTLQDPVIIKISDKPSLYKDKNKIGSCKQISPCKEKFALSDVENCTVTLHITNLTLEDEGTYHVAVYSEGANPLIESNRIYIKVTLSNTTTETTTTAVHENVVTNSPKLELSEQKPFFIFFSASVIIFICLFVGILCWLFRTHPRKPDAENPPVHSNRSTQLSLTLSHSEVLTTEAPIKKPEEKISELHDDTWNIEINETIVEHRAARDWHQYISGSFAQFKCSLCRKGWGSKRVQVLFNFHLDTARNQGTIKVRRFKQKCRRCTEAQWEDPNFPVENIDVLVERLVRNIRIKCYREDLGQTNRSSVFNGRINGPHESAHCEACHKGVCSQAN